MARSLERLTKETSTAPKMAADLRSVYVRAEEQERSRGRPVERFREHSLALRGLLAAAAKGVPPDLEIERPVLFTYPARPGARALPNGRAALELIVALESDLARTPPAFGPGYSTSHNMWDQGLGRLLRPDRRSVGLQVVAEHLPDALVIRLASWDEDGRLRFFEVLAESLRADPPPAEVREARFQVDWSADSRRLQDLIRIDVRGGPGGSYRFSAPLAAPSELSVELLRARADDLFQALETALGKPVFAALNDAALLPLLRPGTLNQNPISLLEEMTQAGQLEWVAHGGGWLVRPLDPDGLEQRSLRFAPAEAFLAQATRAPGWTSAPFLRWVAHIGERQLRSPAVLGILHFVAATGRPVPDQAQLGRDRVMALVFAQVQPESERGRTGQWTRQGFALSPNVRAEVQRCHLRWAVLEQPEGGVPVALTGLNLGQARVEAVVRSDSRLRLLERGSVWEPDQVGNELGIDEFAGLAASQMRFHSRTREESLSGRFAVEGALVGELTISFPNGAFSPIEIRLDRRETVRGTFSELPEPIRRAIESGLPGSG